MRNSRVTNSRRNCAPSEQPITHLRDIDQNVGHAAVEEADHADHRAGEQRTHEPAVGIGCARHQETADRRADRQHAQAPGHAMTAACST